mgnify:CR=1 FL=1
MELFPTHPAQTIRKTPLSEKPPWIDTEFVYWANAQKGAVIREAPDKSRFLGVEVETKNGKEYWAAKKGVVAAAGGYANNAKLCAWFDPRLEKLSTTNQQGATGEVLLAMQDIGAMATGLDYIQCIPGNAPGYTSKGNLIQVIEYSIFVNKEGKRFVAEDSRRDVIRAATLAQTAQTVYPLTDSESFAEDNKFQGDTNAAALKNDMLFEAATLDELAKKIRSGAPRACSRTRSTRRPSLPARSAWRATTRWAAFASSATHAFSTARAR